MSIFGVSNVKTAKKVNTFGLCEAAKEDSSFPKISIECDYIECLFARGPKDFYIPSFVEDDPVVKELCEKIIDLYSSYYEFDSHGVACWFNEEQEFLDKDEMIGLLERLEARLNEINDGSYVVDNYVLRYYRTLKLLTFSEKLDGFLTKAQERHRMGEKFDKWSYEWFLLLDALALAATDLPATVSYFKSCPVETFEYAVLTFSHIGKRADLNREAEDWFLTELLAIENERNADSPWHKQNVRALKKRYCRWKKARK